jgi:tetraacyldisaccharide 4'-kinase
VKKILYPLSVIYSILLKIDKYCHTPKKLDKPVISIGNITCGGNGKTPIVITLLKLLLKNNLKPVVLTRGYYRKGKKTILLKNGAVNINVYDSGDEPLLIARSVPKSVVLVGHNRYKNALRFMEQLQPDIYILDDGFQHWNIYRNLDIVCLNAFNPFGNGLLLPAGILRERPNSLKRAQLIVITNSDMIPYLKLVHLKQLIIKLCDKKPVTTYYGNFKYKQIDLCKDFNLELLLNKKSKNYALSGIGFSEGFHNSIKKSGIQLESSIRLRDHQYYCNNLLNKVIKSKIDNAYFIVTEKDAIKMQNIDPIFKKHIVVLSVQPIFLSGITEWEKTILQIIHHS